MKSQVGVRHQRRILCVFPRYAPSFGTFQHAYPLTDGVRAFMPPQGILVVAAYLPAQWQVRLIDENIRPATREEFAWADAVFVSGMHVQRQEILGIAARARAAGKASVLGGPSVSACPEDYRAFDYLHLGEIGDATDALIRALDDDPTPPPAQRRFATAARLPLAEFPIPAYRLIDGRRYFLGSVQFSSGCPYRCEFCDIPALYGRQPRLKQPAQVLAELDAMLDAGITGSVYFVDDNFIGNKKAARELLPHLTEWQERRGYPLQFSCEATLNLALCPDILAMMRQAYFITVFCGIETPELGALDAMRKSHNRVMPLLDAVETINSYGLEVVSGIILGLDTDKPGTADALLDFIDESRIPLLTINLLQALPKTPLWDRLAREGRLVHDDSLESNVKFLMPYDDVVSAYKRCMKIAYEPSRLMARYLHQCEYTHKNRVKVPVSPEMKSWKNIRRALIMLRNIFWKVGVLGSYRRVFWKFALGRLWHGDLEGLIGSVMIGHHLIMFARAASSGQQNASNYSLRLREAQVPAE